MAITIRIGLFACLWNLGSQAVAEENLFTSPKGYSLRYPSDWVLVTKANLEMHPIERQIRFAMQVNTLGVDSMLSANQREDGTFEANINVILTKENPPVDERLLEIQKRLLTLSHSKRGLKVEWITGRIGSLGAHRATIFDKQATVNSAPQPLRFRQYFLPSSIKDKGLVVTCTSFAEDFGRYEPKFEAILSTFKLEEPSEVNRDDKSHIPKGPIQVSKAPNDLTRLIGNTDERPVFNSPKGYSFSYPSNWTLITEATIGDLPKELQDRFAGERAGREKVDSALLVEVSNGIATNVTVGVLDVPLPIDESALTEVGDEILKQNQSFGFEIHRPTRRIAKVGPNLAMIFDYSTKHRAVALNMRHRQYLVRSGMETLIVTCISRQVDFDQHAPDFDALMASFKVASPTLMPESPSSSPPATPSDTSDATFIYCVLGAMLVFGAIGILKICRRSPQRATREQR